MPALGSVILSTIPNEFNFDAGMTMPDQNADGLYEACTAYCQTDICVDEDKVIYDPKTLYIATMKVMGIAPTDARYLKVACDIRDSLKAVCNLYQRGGYFNILDASPFDAFDTIRMVMWTQKRTASIGSPWSGAWENLSPQGIVPNANFTASEWHNYKFSGVHDINGVLYLVGKSWQGRNYGDQGLAYFSREVVNQALSQSGSFAYTLIPKSSLSGTIETVKLPWWQELLSRITIFVKSFNHT